jgi:chitodextrinase
VLFHDATRTGQDVHTECLFAMGVQGLTVKNSRFRNCAVFNAYVGKIGSDPNPRDVLFENNVMEPSIDVGSRPAYYSMIFDKAAFQNVTLRNNTFAQEVLFGDSSTNTSFSNTLVVGNILPKNGTCNAGVTFRYNVMRRTCGTGDKAVSSLDAMYVNPDAGDYHLRAGAAAIDAADPGNAPDADADGRSRSGAPDAGAYEYGGGAATPAPTPTPTPEPEPAPPSGDTRAPSVPQGMTWTADSQTQVTLRWNASSDNVGVTGYRVYRNGDRITTTTQTSHTITGLACDSSHTLVLTAIDAAGNESNGAEATTTATTRPCATSGGSGSAGLVGAWGMNEASGATVGDASDSGGTGTIAGATRAAGRYGNGLRFDGAGDLVTVPDSSALDLTDAMTLEAWVYPTERSAMWRTVMLKEQPSHLAYGLYADNGDGLPTAQLFPGGDGALAGGSAIPLNQWTHLATTWDGATLRLFVNGRQVASRALSGTLAQSSRPLRIGGNQVWSEWFEGSLDEVRVYNRALSAAEIVADRDTPIQ